MKNSPIAKIAAATAALGFAAVAMAPAAVAEDTFSVKVHYDTAELLTEEGIQNVVERMEAKAKEACGHKPGYMTIADRKLVDKCTKVALSDALEQIKRPQLAEALRETLG